MSLQETLIAKFHVAFVAIRVELNQPFDPSHDWDHVMRVYENCCKIAIQEGARMPIVWAGALGHDLVDYPKNSPNADNSTLHSAERTRTLLREILDFPQEMIPDVCQAIEVCSFSKNAPPPTMEAAIIQDGDMLEATGAISVLRTFCSTGQFRRPFFHPEDPFCETGREPEPKKYAADLFQARLLRVVDRMNTNAGKDLAKRRHADLLKIIEMLREDIR